MSGEPSGIPAGAYDWLASWAGESPQRTEGAAARLDETRLGELAVRYGWITPRQLDEALQEQGGDGREDPATLGAVFLRRRWLGADQLAYALAMLGAPAARPERRRVGRYEIIGELGQGGMGKVYRAMDPALRREVALKLLTETGSEEEQFRRRFEREAAAMARLRHPNIVAVYEYGEESGTPFLAMELLAGPSLEEAWEAEPRIERRVELLEKVAGAIAFAHERGIVHRDVKPGNVRLGADGEPRVMDFGLAHVVGERTRITMTGTVMGTPAYMAPEQVRGEHVGPAADVYALGAMLYEALSGSVPFMGSQAHEVYQKILAEEPVRPRRLNPRAPVELEIVALKAIEKEVHRRYAGAAEFAEELRRWRAGEPIRARPATWTTRIGKRVRRHPWASAVSTALAVVLLAGAPLAVWQFVRFNRMKRQVDAAALGRWYDETYRQLREVILVADDVGFGAPPEREVDELLAEAERVLSEIPAPWSQTSLPHAYRGWILANLGRVAEGEAELDRAVAAGGLQRSDPYGLVFRARWRARRLYASLVPGMRLTPGEGVVMGNLTLPEASVEEVRSLSAEVGPIAEWPGWKETREGRHYQTLMQGLSLVVRAERPEASHVWPNREAAGIFAQLSDSPELAAEGSWLEGLARYRTSDLDEAMKCFRRALALRERWCALWVLLASVQVGRASEILPQDPRGAISLVDDSLDAWSTYLRLRPDDKETHAHRARSFRLRGDAETALGQDPRASYRDSLRDFETALAGEPEDYLARYSRGLTRTALAEAEADQGEDPRELLRLAVEDLDYALTANPDLRIGLLARAQASLRLAIEEEERGGDPSPLLARALSDAERAVSMIRDADALNRLGAVRQRMASALRRAGQDPSEAERLALEAFDEAISRDPASWHTRFNKGVLLEEMGRTAEAAEAYRSVLSLQPADPEGLRLAQEALRRIEGDEEF